MRILRYLLPIGFAAFATACSAEATDETGSAAVERPAAEEAAPAPPKAPATAAAGSISVEEETDHYTFHFHAPVEVSRYPELSEWLAYQRDESRTAIKAQAQEEAERARDVNFPFRPHYLSIVWSRAADLPGWLSLGALIETYSGGAHPNHEFSSMLWDKRENRERAVEELFTTPEALSQAIRAPFCKELARQRLEKRGQVLEPTSENDPFADCVDPLESTVLLTGGDSGFDGMRVLIAPYIAGPYAEGSYEIDLKITPALRAALKPEYRDAFAR